MPSQRTPTPPSPASTDAGTGAQESLRTGLFLRGLALARLSLSVGTRAASQKIGGFFSSEEGAEERLRERLIEQAKDISTELGRLKGSVMKVGQMLSIYGEQFLPPEANIVLKTLQSQAPPLEWTTLAPVIEKELGTERMNELEIERTAVASASIGQVHRARVKATGEVLALKIQYPGVDQAIESDLKALKTMVSLARLMPHVPHLETGIQEIQSMLRQELDYELEARQLTAFRERLEGDSRYLVPRVHSRWSSGRVLATDFIDGWRIDDPTVLSLPQESRNAIAEAALELYFNEIFAWRSVQTDPHFGNFLIVRNEGPQSPHRLALFDFGAVREFDTRFVELYGVMTSAALKGDRAALCTAAEGIGFLKADDCDSLRTEFFDFCVLVMEPFNEKGATEDAKRLFENGRYDWKRSDLPRRLSQQLAKVISAHKFRPPPREMIFLDRKTSGLFVLLATIGAKVNGRPLLERHLAP